MKQVERPSSFGEGTIGNSSGNTSRTKAMMTEVAETGDSKESHRGSPGGILNDARDRWKSFLVGRRRERAFRSPENMAAEKVLLRLLETGSLLPGSPPDYSDPSTADLVAEVDLLEALLVGALSPRKRSKRWLENRPLIEEQLLVVKETLRRSGGVQEAGSVSDYVAKLQHAYYSIRT